MSDAQDWAWEQLKSPAHDFELDDAVVFLAAARHADLMLKTGHGYSCTSAEDVVALLPRLKLAYVSAVLDDLHEMGFLARDQWHDGWRIPEEAFS